jgi:hypothetical protein
MKMPVGAFCAFLGFCRLVRYFTLFLGHAEFQSVMFGCVKSAPHDFILDSEKFFDKKGITIP